MKNLARFVCWLASHISKIKKEPGKKEEGVAMKHNCDHIG